ncbi:MAG TPA: TRAP transporter substrate-binding protein DctP [Ramlibacter sp.]|uniref:TRAP transporter substrate-binding protein n=1 Tax=Ramlibacter sp. TaxID=1917967 RepID=UPI002D80B4E0|nr:TRAP transporter substrate-binding protein DctP [Ramlibacter sp.]HET8744649.1 TRAP transporter substrate-binding protein DctP [Ramlibacter sp.]
MAATAVASPAIAQSSPELKWRMPTSWPKSLDTIYGAAEIMCKAVSDATDGKFQIQPFAAGEIVPGLAIVDAVQNGTVEIGHTASYYYFGKDPTFGFGTSVPFGPNFRLNQAWWTQAGGDALLNDFYKKYNARGLLAGNTGCQMGGWYRKEIKTVADIKGLKMRIGGFAGRVLERMGGVPQNIPGGEIYQALEKGTIDAAEWIGPYDDLKLGFHKVAPYYYYPGWWEGGLQLDLYVNRKAYDALSAENKAIIEAASAYAHVDMQAKYDARNPAALKQLVAQGAKLRPFPADVMAEAFKQSMGLYQELNTKNQNWNKVYGDYARFRSDQNLWFRFTEATFDRFMQAQKL